jgi:nucleoside-diphosphate-sugar epimerase
VNRPVAVTGATGRLGAPLVDALLGAGCVVRALSRRPQPPRTGIQWVIGDLLDAGAVAALIADAETVFHVGGQLQGAPGVIERSLVEGTQNVLQAAGAVRLVYVSSLVVLDAASTANSRVIDENSPLEPFPERRGTYTRAKSAAEAMARAAAGAQDVVIVRPGLVVSPEATIPPSIGIRIGPAVFLVGPRNAMLPAVHAADVASGLLCAAARLDSGDILHLVDPLAVTRIALLRRLGTGNHRALAIPSGGAVLALARLAATSGVPRLANAAYRLVSAGNPHQWTAGRATALGWRPQALATWLAAGATSS